MSGVTDPAAVEPARRDAVLPRGWRTSADVAWTTSGDGNGFHVLVAAARDGYAWRTAATLSEPGFETDRWIGNACVTASGRRVVVVYAPRAFTNRPELTRRGGFTAVVDLISGAVRKLSVTSSLAYFNPGCGAGERAVLTQEGDEDLAGTRLVGVRAGTGALDRPVVAKGQVTSAVPTSGGIVAAAGHRLVRVAANGATAAVPGTASAAVPYGLAVDAGGGIVFADVAGATARVRRLSGTTVTTLATGPADRLRVARGAGNRVFLTGEPASLSAPPAAVGRLAVPARADVSTTGALAVTLHDTPPAAGAAAKAGNRPAPLDAARPVRLHALVPSTGQRLAFAVTPGRPVDARTAEQGRSISPLGEVTTAAVGSPTNPVDTERYCSVPRNDVRTQVYQPTARQVEWAADQAVVGALTLTRPANWKNSGLPAYSPQGWFPPVALSGGGRVPAQILLGILAQESNLWQASNHALPGEYGNPLVGNFYGRSIYDDNEGDDWIINWAEADCGYGVGQVTDGMRLAGHARPGEVLLPADRQRAVAVDYAANIAAALQILQRKWNETRDAGLTINNGFPEGLENWFFAAWAYNSGFYPQSQAGTRGGAWGVGWLNNPINPRYDQTRPPFLEYSWADARTPQRWPYQEKVLGFAGHSLSTVDGPGFRAAWWTSVAERIRVKPPASYFCDTSNACVPGGLFPNNVDYEHPFGPCSRADLLCYYHQPVTWKADCNALCGNELLRFDTTYPEQPDGTHFPPMCTTAGLSAGALLIDNVLTSVPAPRCGTARWTSNGTFSLNFAGDGTGKFQSKVDFHQIGGGFGSHFWFAHTRTTGDQGGKLAVTGKWTLNQSITGWARVLVHMPDHGAHTRQAKYTINLGNGKTAFRVAPQRTQQHRWVSLGVFPFAGVPSVTLSTVTADGRGEEDVAWDAVAFQKLPGKPRDVVVAMGDSYSSGEGASVTGGGDYYRETDVDGDDPPWRNACHRSRHAWSRKARMPGNAISIGARADGWDPTMDYHMVACSGAQTENLLPLDGTVANSFGERGKPQYGELPQVDQGYLDANTTLVTVSIGGNDARFGDVVKQCIYAAGVNLCQNSVLSGDTQPLRDAEPAIIRGPVRQSIVTVLKEIRKRAPNARIVLMGYPILVENVARPCIPGLDAFEVAWMAEMGNLLAEQMAAAAAEATAEGAPTTFSDPRSQFRGKGICGSPETIHGIVIDKTPGDQSGLVPPSSQSFHPKIEGAAIYANVLNATLAS
jgi:hypothetical protein